MYCLYEYGEYGEEILYHFLTEELAQKMKEKLVSLGIKHESSCFIRKINVIENEHHPYFDIKKADYYLFDGEIFNFRSINNTPSSFLSESEDMLLSGKLQWDDNYSNQLRVNRDKWNTYLNDYYRYLHDKNEYPKEVKNEKDFEETVHHLVLCRPVEWGKEAIESEWKVIYAEVVKLHENGLSKEEVNRWLKVR